MSSGASYHFRRSCIKKSFVSITLIGFPDLYGACTKGFRAIVGEFETKHGLIEF